MGMQGTSRWVGMPEEQGETSRLWFRLQRKILNRSYRGKYKIRAWSTAVTNAAFKEHCGMM